MNSVLEAAMRTDDGEIIYNAIKDFVDIDREPYQRLLTKLISFKNLPDRLFLLLNDNYSHMGALAKKKR